MCQIRYEDTHLLVIHKPAGLLSQGDASQDPNLVDWLRNYLGRPYVGLVHRLDRNTSGLLVVAKRTKSAERLSRSLLEGTLLRRYLGIVRGHLPLASTSPAESPAPQRLIHFLKKNPQTNEVRVVAPSAAAREKGVQQAILEFLPLAHGSYQQEPITLVQFQLETGRSHQIRVQMAHLGHPLLGDQKYTPAAGRSLRTVRFHRPALHSAYLEFPHPMSRESLSFEDPLPEDLNLFERRSWPLRFATPERQTP
jgi:23S rRNA pseudouridine1911/1915/1917 synthase